MSIVGLITEYNPFHNGHVYHINKAKEITNSDSVIVVMSGSFTQSGNIAIYDKFKRANVAINSGADLVIELPTIYANSSANYFAFGAVNLLNKLNIVDAICFGSENDNIDTLINIAQFLILNDSKIQSEIKFELKKGNSYAISRENALLKYLNLEQISNLKLPNNILGIEYIKNLFLLKSNIKPFCIKRIGANFNECNTEAFENFEFQSATNIRNYISKNVADNDKNTIKPLEKYVPNSMINIIKNSKALFNESLYEILKYRIVNYDIKQLNNIFEVTEGLENKIKKEINNSNTYYEYIQNIKSKRYELSKIKRMLNNIILNITKSDFDYAYNNNITYAHILACNNKGRSLISKISKSSNIQLVTSINDKLLLNLPKNINKYITLDILASNIHSILCNENINKDYTNRL